MAESSGGPPLSVDPQGVITSVKGIDDVTAQLKKDFSQLKSEAETVIKGSWTGAAADKVHAGWHEWQDGFDKIARALEQVNGIVGQAAHQFHQADQAG
ncbi:WXG100 family type VII secretion target [Mycobacterium camsae]|uniref:WXG100 family type VII secretion target n=1 Tax=Mycobacterium gordonae TaxID=1778 RepID=UPI00197F835F|nr:WXG100 family type VII secretion target [Mycobacterium gordonae]